MFFLIFLFKELIYYNHRVNSSSDNCFSFLRNIFLLKSV